MSSNSSVGSRINNGSQVYSNYGNVNNNFYGPKAEKLEELLTSMTHILKVQLQPRSSGEGTSEKQRRKKKKKHHKQESSDTERSLGQSAEEYLSTYLYDPQLVPRDCQQLIKMQFDLRNLDEDRLLALTTDRLLQSWISAGTPVALLVNGGASSLPQSETSFLCAKIVESMTSNRVSAGHEVTTAVLAYFCGQHRDSQDVYSNSSELIMSLLLQLVDFCRVVTPSLPLTRMSDLVPSDVTNILDVFVELVRTLGDGIQLVIILDGVEFFGEPVSRGRSTAVIVKRLLDLHSEQLAVTLKLLFASPSRATFLEDLFANTEVLTLPRYPRPSNIFDRSKVVEISTIL